MCSFSVSFSISITEIQFDSEEFVEIVVNETEFLSFNESYFNVEDSGNNSFSLRQSHQNSSIILIVGSNFISEAEEKYDINISNLNCKIYQTEGSEVGFFALNNGGEAFKIQFSSNLNVSYDNLNTPTFNDNETLHFNSTYQYKSSFSPCELDNSQKEVFGTILQFSSYNDSSPTQTNFSHNDSINFSTNNQENIKSSCELNLDVDDIIEDSKIQFTFTGNTSLGVTYFIEDGASNVVRSPFTSSTASSKSYTPRKNGKFIVFGEINDENCSKEIKVNESTFFYNSQLDKEENNDDSDSSSSSSTPRVERDTYINILQAVQISPNQIKLMVDVSRGDSRSYRMKINVNDEEVAQYDVGKYGNFDFEIPLTLEVGKNTIEVTGFGEEDKIDITINEIESNMDEEMEDMIRNIVKEEQEELLKNSNLNSNDLTTFNDETSNILRNSISEDSRDSIPASTVMFENENNNLNDDKSTNNFSKHFFYQNTGVLFIVIGLVLVAGVIIILR